MPEIGTGSALFSCLIRGARRWEWLAAFRGVLSRVPQHHAASEFWQGGRLAFLSQHNEYE